MVAHLQRFRTILRVAGALLIAGLFPVLGQPSNGVTTAPIYVPDFSHASEPFPDGVFAWDATQKTVAATNGQHVARFVFAFTNISPDAVSILSGRGSCSCTTIQMPPTPWLIPAGGTGEITILIDLAGKVGQLFKQAIISTDKGMKNLALQVSIQPPSAAPMTEEERARGIAAAKIDRQAVFKGDCATCHAKNIPGQYGAQLFAVACAICHEANPRASMVPDLHNLKDPTSDEFWRAWITSGKPGTLMPAFATSQGGPLDDLQIVSLAAYLNATIPSHVPPPPPK